MDSLLTYKIAPQEYVQGRYIPASRTPPYLRKALAGQERDVGVNMSARLEIGLQTLPLGAVGNVVRTFDANGVVFLRADVGTEVFLKQLAHEA